MLGPIEGDEVVLQDGSIWCVKGCYHPEGHVIAIPRVVHGRVIKRFHESYQVISRYYRHFLRHVPEVGYEVPLVPLTFVSKYLRALQTKCYEDLPKNLYKACVELIEILSSLNIQCGLSGSILGRYYTRSSDIDIVCLDRSNVYDELLKLRRENVLRPLNVNEFLKELISVSEVLNVESHLRLIKFKVLQGIFKGVRYTLKVVNCSRMSNVLGPYKFRLKVNNVLVKIIRSDYRIPCILEAQLIRPSDILGAKKLRLLSHRIRFTEIPEGSIIYIEEAYLFLRSPNELLLNLDISSKVVVV